MNRFVKTNSRRILAALCLLIIALVVALPVGATTAEPEVSVGIDPSTTETLTQPAPTAPTAISDADASDSDVSDSDVSPSDQKGTLTQSLVLMGQGMLGIFVVMLLIYLVIVLLNKFASGKKADDANN